jgi:hypothetical protein
MKRLPTVFLQTVTVLVGIGALALMLWEPHLEGRNVHATLFEIYFRDPFLAYAYLASIPFFVALYQVFRLWGYVGQRQASSAALKALTTIKYCAVSLIGLIVLPEVYLLVVRPEDDIAGGVAMGLFLIVVFAVVAATAAVYERVLQKA